MRKRLEKLNRKEEARKRLAKERVLTAKKKELKAEFGPKEGFMGGDSEEYSDENEEEAVRSSRMVDYSERSKSFFMLFSTLSPKVFVKRFKNYMREQDVEAKLDSEDWSLSFKIEQELDKSEIESGIKPDTC